MSSEHDHPATGLPARWVKTTAAGTAFDPMRTFAPIASALLPLPGRGLPASASSERIAKSPLQPRSWGKMARLGGANRRRDQRKVLIAVGIYRQAIPVVPR